MNQSQFNWSYNLWVCSGVERFFPYRIVEYELSQGREFFQEIEAIVSSEAPGMRNQITRNHSCPYSNYNANSYSYSSSRESANYRLPCSEQLWSAPDFSSLRITSHSIVRGTIYGNFIRSQSHYIACTQLSKRRSASYIVWGSLSLIFILFPLIPICNIISRDTIRFLLEEWGRYE